MYTGYSSWTHLLNSQVDMEFQWFPWCKNRMLNTRRQVTMLETCLELLSENPGKKHVFMLVRINIFKQSLKGKFGLYKWTLDTNAVSSGNAHLRVDHWTCTR